MSERTRAAVTEYFRRLSTGDRDSVVELFAEDVRWDIPGATELVPWLGSRRDRAEIREFFDQLDQGLIPGRFELERLHADGPHAVAIGRLRATIRATGKVIDSAFTIQFEVDEDGLISEYLLLEDSWQIANAVRP
ncbi:nuclear transport factor 2 family protein [Kibdelosporangium persicum]|uniref:SnoaL-like domain-containing protein n=1 Tax=Kibdelosporangium persicum TaxID=2698649 RepID=A0ABX2F560_9PSEU|nr:nuclear transport factor 2 family protein [Kibdelosporangium persicum]NRN66491.1 SnoaL-like domain-containing protein [Kibdelosporangium persicum]